MKICTIFGTRPEIIKLSSLIPLLEQTFDHLLIHTGQHYDHEMDQIFFEELKLPKPKYNLHIGSSSQGTQTAQMLEQIEHILTSEKPNVVLVQGDTNTTLAGALAASKLNIPIIHLEAGCRSFNRRMPEEINRVVVDQLAELLLPADEDSVRNLLNEGLPENKIHLVGNTIFDACVRNLHLTEQNSILDELNLTPNQYILSTIHRAENTQETELKNIVDAFNDLGKKIKVVFPLHPRTKMAMEKYNLSFNKEIIITKPLSYIQFLTLLAKSRICISDSGGVQDEALVCNIPCLIPRYETEWPRLVNAKKNYLIGNKYSEIISNTLRFITDDEQLNKTKSIIYPYESNIDQKVIDIIKKYFTTPLQSTSKKEQKKLKIGLFAYNFKHKKTQDGILNLFLQNISIDVIFAADPVDLKFYQSKIRVAPKDLSHEHPKDIAKRLHIPYHVVIHNSAECEQLIKNYDLDLGIILGARILKENIVNAFKIGILNMHPGLLPENRGLDNLKWAILQNYRQGVSVHLIDKNIDKGNLILRKPINVYEDDTLIDLFLRLQNLEQSMMIEAVHLLESGKREFEVIEEGNYRKAVPEEEEVALLDKFEEYKKKYQNLPQ